MTRIKLCGLTRTMDIQAANGLRPDYVGFVFFAKSRRNLSPKQAAKLKEALDPGIQAVGVFVDEAPEKIALLLEEGVIDVAQLHGQEDISYFNRLRELTGKPIIKAFRVEKPEDCLAAENFPSEYLLLDSGMGSGVTFDWSAVAGVKRDFFLAGGLSPENVADAIKNIHPFGVDVSSGIESDGVKDYQKMAAFVAAVRKEEA
ncbi:MAG: phosphoribosylanthranilate isomerase [Clostridia bacterium]|nr:phosphoribosylanthranilate isomerase [Clostridia bacterium]